MLSEDIVQLAITKVGVFIEIPAALLRMPTSLRMSVTTEVNEEVRLRLAFGKQLLTCTANVYAPSTLYKYK